LLIKSVRPLASEPEPIDTLSRMRCPGSVGARTTAA